MQQTIPTVQDKFKIKTSSLTREQVAVMKNYQSSGEQHLEYYYRTMSAFKDSSRRVKCFDTTEYEEMLPQVKKILADYELIMQLPDEQD